MVAVPIHPIRGWFAETLEEEPESGDTAPLEEGRVAPLSQRLLEKDRVTRLLSAYVEKAEIAETTADALYGKTVALERDMVRGKERPLPGVPLYQHPQLVQARLEWMQARQAEEHYYLAWLHAINDYVGVPWEGRVEIIELAGWYTGIVRTGKSYGFCEHRDGSPAQYNSLKKAVLWLHPVMLRHAPDAD